MADRQEIQLHRVYKHFKGDYYLVEDLARDSETDEEVEKYQFQRCDCIAMIKYFSGLTM